MGAASAAVAPQPLLEVRHVHKAFPGVLALDDVSLELARGTVHAVVGENGAGKSTLMKIIAGLESPDAGELRFAGRTLRLRSPRQALAHGIAMIHQELNLMPTLSVAENIWIGREPRAALGLIRHGELGRRTHALLERLGIDLDPEAEVRTLSIAARQMLEIARALSFDSQLLIMDEPTSALTAREAQQLFAIIRELKARGTGILYITHRLDELGEVADELTVLRDGRRVGQGTVGSFGRDELIRLMVGRELGELFPAPPACAGAVSLAVRRLALAGHFADVSFELHAGEILGVAGLIGSGRSALAATLFGLTPATSGEILIGGRSLRIGSPQAAIAAGVALVTEDRKETGCFLALSVLENLSIAALLGSTFVRLGFVRRAPLEASCAAMLRALRVKTRALEERIGNLSGGNQQKVLIGRWLLTAPRILILDEPTRGVDVGAKAEIHQLIGELTARGAAVLMISSELPEVLGISHRVLVMRDGRLTGILGRAEADPVKIMALAAG
jgi:inositol transport system ATP-binding protein